LLVCRLVRICHFKISQISMGFSLKIV